jgi:hypothetical protein
LEVFYVDLHAAEIERVVAGGRCLDGKLYIGVEPLNMAQVLEKLPVE